MSHANRQGKDARREQAIRATPCPVCGAAAGAACRQGVAPHDARRGAEDLRPALPRCHRERRAAWVASQARP